MICNRGFVGTFDLLLNAWNVRKLLLSEIRGLLIMLAFSLLSIDSPPNSGDLIFGIVFMIVWAGSCLVTLNARLLKGTT
jgi:xanthosine utilization system XapX-like protein